MDRSHGQGSGGRRAAPEPVRRWAPVASTVLLWTACFAALLVNACDDPTVSLDQPPVAFAGYDQTLVLSHDPSHGRAVAGGLLDGRRSQDPEQPDADLGFVWTQTLGPDPLLPLDAALPRQIVWLTEPGLYAFELVVHFGGQASVPDVVHLMVREPTECEPRGVEECNGLDDDCDGVVDEDLQPPAATLQAGVCQGAVQQCGGRAGWLEPELATLPGYEDPEASCDGQDNDCDGSTDEGFDADGDGVPDCFECSLLRFPQLGQPCQPGGGCPARRWGCRITDVGPQLTCEPSLHMVEALPCGHFERPALASMVRNVSGSLAWVGPNEPRFEHDGLLDANALLLEGERTSLIRSSGALSGGRWHLSPEPGPELVPAPFLAPDGGPALSLASEAVDDSLYQRDLVARAGASLWYSVYLRRADASGLALALEVGGGEQIAALAVPATWERATVHVAWPPDDERWARFVLRRVGPPAGPAQVAVWGPQVEQAPFPSSYFVTTQDGGTRPADRLSFSAELLGVDEGTITFWMRPRYPAGVEDPSLVVSEVEGWLRCMYEGAGPQVRCALGDEQLSVDATGLGPEGWSFVALTVSAAEGAQLYLGVSGALRSASLAGPLVLAPLGPEPLRPLPLFARSRDLRVFARHLAPEEIQGLFDQDLPSYP